MAAVAAPALEEATGLSDQIIASMMAQFLPADVAKEYVLSTRIILTR